MGRKNFESKKNYLVQKNLESHLILSLKESLGAEKKFEKNLGVLGHNPERYNPEYPQPGGDITRKGQTS